MKQDHIIQLLDELAEATQENPRADLGSQIKDHIPGRLIRHRVNWNTVNVVVDFRMSRSIAAAAILVAILLLSGLFHLGNGSGTSVYQDSKLLLRYGFGGESAARSDLIESLKNFYDDLVRQGRDVTFYGESADPEDRHAILMHWKMPNGEYRVVYNDLSARTISAAALVRLQSRMIQKHRQE